MAKCTLWAGLGAIPYFECKPPLRISRNHPFNDLPLLELLHLRGWRLLSQARWHLYFKVRFRMQMRSYCDRALTM